MAAIGLVVHKVNDRAKRQATQLASWLGDHDHVLRMLADDAAVLNLPECAVDELALPQGLDLMVSLGGDGSMLQAVDLVADHGVPVLGVNFGRMGYLTEFEPDGLQSAVERFFDGETTIEERMRLAVTVERADGSLERGGSALNEAIAEKKVSGRTVRLNVEIDGVLFTEYSADGVIVATPTGSTAYSLSARGPIVAPKHEALILTAVAPHMLFDRSLVLPPDSAVRIEVVSDRSASLAVDGRGGVVLAPGDAIIVARSPVAARLVGSDRDFLGVLKEKFGLDGRE